MTGDINRDWKAVDWKAEMFQRDKRIVVTASIGGWVVRSYEFSDGFPAEQARMFDDMLAALNQHRGKV